MADSQLLCVTYIPADCGSILPGKSKAPEAFREAGVVRKLEEAGILSVSEHHALESPARYVLTDFAPGRLRSEDLNVAVCQQVFRTIAQNLAAPPKNPPFQLVLGGECAQLPAVMSAFWYHAASRSPSQRVGLIYIDADTDLASPTDPGSTGNLSGMNLTHLARTHGAVESMKQFSRSSGEPVCDASNTVLFGTNMSFPGNKPEHFAYLFDHEYKVISSASVAKEPEKRAREALKHLKDKVDVILVHLDVDSIDPSMFPLANLPNFTGVAFEHMMRALSVLLTDHMVGGLMIAEVNPDHDPGLGLVEKLTNEVVAILGAKFRR